MRKIIAIIAAVPSFVMVGAATDFPAAEAFLGYNFVRFNTNSGIVPSFNANGGDGQFAYNVNKYLGVVVDLGAVNKGTLQGFNFDTTVVNFVAGPRFTWRHHDSRFQPFVQALFGGAYATTSVPIDITVPVINPGPPGGILQPNGPVTARLVASNTGFAMMAGGGLDIKLNKHVAFRPVGLDYYQTRVPGLLTGTTTSKLNNFRYSAGINFLFGKM
ncbi:MAG: hypothetical protein WBY44_24255 [Bryobacteraceae bacterium]|jgi:hypothetical protein